ncbi:MAG: cupredoxin domain-containing protein [Thermomicrobiales bacterium]|nr:cupredoxin domain-containing protein [Thermomicrobiales bacterium]MCO5221945.1 plastocyanin/azurin family copper-binding protein [Thermomicrobiales bacterium]
MNPKRIVALIVLAAVALLPLHFSHAGGWASVEIVDGPDVLEIGKPMTMQLSIKQHGINPVDIDPLVISATQTETGKTIEETAAKATGDGNYTIELTFPSKGIWNLEGRPGSFPAFDMGPVKVGQTLGSTPMTAPSGALVIDITGGMGSGAFDPTTTEIVAGTLVVWVNNSTEGHTIVIDGTNESSGLIGPGAAYARIFDEPGTYRYVCGPHPNMTGEIVVR